MYAVVGNWAFSSGLFRRLAPGHCPAPRLMPRTRCRSARLESGLIRSTASVAPGSSAAPAISRAEGPLTLRGHPYPGRLLTRNPACHPRFSSNSSYATYYYAVRRGSWMAYKEVPKTEHLAGLVQMRRQLRAALDWPSLNGSGTCCLFATEFPPDTVPLAAEFL